MGANKSREDDADRDEEFDDLIAVAKALPAAARKSLIERLRREKEETDKSGEMKRQFVADLRKKFEQLPEAKRKELQKAELQPEEEVQFMKAAVRAHVLGKPRGK